MDDYISRDSVCLNKHVFYYPKDGIARNNGYDQADWAIRISDVMDLPAADMRPVVRGKWENAHPSSPMPEVNLFYQQLEEQCGPDYIKVIRCKDCREYDTEGYDETPGFGWCECLHRDVQGCFYCAHGEKGENK